MERLKMFLTRQTRNSDPDSPDRQISPVGQSLPVNDWSESRKKPKANQNASKWLSYSTVLTARLRRQEDWQGLQLWVRLRSADL